MTGRELSSWWYGRPLPTFGIAGVVVAAEMRGSGLLHRMLQRVLADAAERGQVLSALFPTAPGIYRGAGFEVVAELMTIELATRDASAVGEPSGYHTRRATAADLAAQQHVYEDWASAQNGPLTRSEVRHGSQAPEAPGTGTSLAVDDRERVAGYCRWVRCGGYGSEGSIDVREMIAVTLDGYRALWRMLATFAPVAPVLRLTTSGHDAALMALPSTCWRLVDRHPYMLRLLDVCAAFTGPGAEHTRGEMEFDVVGDAVAQTVGRYRLSVEPGAVHCERIDVTNRADNVTTITPQGLALLWSGAQDCANLRMAGLMWGGTPGEDALLRTVCAARPIHVRDYF
jgi:predicted acetyltransferase